MFRVKSSFLLTDDSDTIVIRFARRDCPIVRDISLSSKSFHIFRVDRKCYLFIYLFQSVCRQAVMKGIRMDGTIVSCTKMVRYLVPPETLSDTLIKHH